MSTPAQVAANQKNAQLSTGPTSAAGKENSSRNNLQHGFRGKFSFIGKENPAEFDRLRVELHAEYEPQSITERLLIDNMAEHYWLVRRARSLQHMYTEAPQYSDGDKIILAKLTLFIRYETQHDRAFHKCLSQLLKLKEEKRQTEIGFERQKRAEAAAKRKEEEAQQKEAVAKQKQEAHETKLRLAQAKADQLELNTAIDSMMQTACPGNTTLVLNGLKQAVLEALHAFSQKQTSKVAAA